MNVIKILLFSCSIFLLTACPDSGHSHDDGGNSHDDAQHKHDSIN